MMAKSLTMLITKSALAVLLCATITSLQSQNAINCVSADNSQLGISNVDIANYPGVSNDLITDVLSEAIEDMETELNNDNEAVVNTAAEANPIETKKRRFVSHIPTWLGGKKKKSIIGDDSNEEHAKLSKIPSIKRQNSQDSLVETPIDELQSPRHMGTPESARHSQRDRTPGNSDRFTPFHIIPNFDSEQEEVETPLVRSTRRSNSIERSQSSRSGSTASVHVMDESDDVDHGYGINPTRNLHLQNSPSHPDLQRSPSNLSVKSERNIEPAAKIAAQDKAVRNIGRAADIKLKNEEKEYKKNIQSLKSHQRESVFSKFRKVGRLFQNNKVRRSAKNMDQIKYLSQLDSEADLLQQFLYSASEYIQSESFTKSVAKLFSVSDEIEKSFHYLNYNPYKTLSDRKINEIQNHINIISAEIPVQTAIRTQLESEKIELRNSYDSLKKPAIHHDRAMNKKLRDQHSNLIKELKNLFQICDKLLKQKAITALDLYRFKDKMISFDVISKQYQDSNKMLN